MSLCVCDFALLHVICMYACVICMSAFRARCSYMVRCMYVIVFDTCVGCVRYDVGCTFVPVKCKRVHLSRLIMLLSWFRYVLCALSCGVLYSLRAVEGFQVVMAASLFLCVWVRMLDMLSNCACWCDVFLMT
jgi:predicted permease